MFDLREIRGFLTATGAFGAFAVLLASAPYLLPGQPLLQSLRFHVAIALLLVAAGLLLSRGRWRGALFGLLALVSLGEGFYWVNLQQDTRIALSVHAETQRIRVLSFNMLVNNRRAGDVADAILEQDADVVFTFESASLYQELPRLLVRYPFRLGCAQAHSCDTMMLSKTPLTGGLASLGPFSGNRVIVAASEIDGLEVHLVAVHMTKPYFDLAAEGESYRLRRVLAELEGPVIVGGDFNAAPWSGNLRRLLRDALLMPAPWYPATWPVRLGPLGVPIDNLFTRSPAVIETIEALPDAFGSNHRALIATVQFADDL